MTLTEIFQKKYKLDVALSDIDKRTIIRMTFYNYKNECLPFYLESETDLNYVSEVLNRTNFIDKGNYGTLLNKLNLKATSKSTYELDNFIGIDTILRKLIVGIMIR